MLEHREITERIIGLAIEVHRTIGPGLLEHVYTSCLCQELENAGIPFEREFPIPVIYKGKIISMGFRADILVDHTILLEIKSAAALLPVHEAQVLTYLRLSRYRVALLFNFGASRLKDGLRRYIH